MSSPCGSGKKYKRGHRK
ncbi:SEC-C metal-binding domain-containing protein [Chloroflexota bacterium]